MRIAQTLADLLMLYLSCGLLFGSAFISAGASKVDAAARGTSVFFRLLILPATVAFWPFLAAKWLQASRQGETP